MSTPQAAAKTRKARPRLIWLLVLVLMLVSTASLYIEAQAYTQPLEYLDGVLGWLVAPLVFSGIGALIIERRPNHRIGWLMMLVITGVTVPALLDHLLLGPILSASTLTPGQTAYALFSAFSWWLIIAPTFLIFLLYPNGELPTPRWRRVVHLLLFALVFDVVLFSLGPTLEVGGAESIIANPLALLPQEIMDAGLLVFALLLISTCLLALASVFVRYRRAQNLERAQMRWLFLSAVVFFSIYFLNILLGFSDQDLLASILFALGFISIPAAIGIGILRYRLWDIDVVVNRSLLYGLLTAILAALFAAITALSAQVAKNYFGEDGNQVAAAVGALAVAGVFQPLRTALEKAINRRLFPENVDLAEGLSELNPELWPFISLNEILQASLEHLQDIYKFDKAVIYTGRPGANLSAQAAIGAALKDFGQHTLTEQEQAAFAQKKSTSSHKPGAEFPVSVPLYWARRRAPHILGVLHLGKRAEGRGYSVDELKALQSFGGKLGRAIYALDASKR